MIIPTSATIFEVDPASDRVVATVDGQITVFHLGTGVAIQSVALPSPQSVLAFTPDTAFAWIALDAQQGKIARLSLTTGQYDQQIQLTGGTPPYTIKAQVYRPDPRILLVSANAGVFNATRAYAGGILLPGAAPPDVAVPLGIDDRGRLLMWKGIACQLSIVEGFTNCAAAIPGLANNFTTISALWKTKALFSGNILDTVTGNLLFRPISAATDALYLASSNRLLLRSNNLVAADADSFESYADVGTLLPSLQEAPRRIWSPDWVLASMVASSPVTGVARGILVGHLPQLAPAPLFSVSGVVNAATLKAADIAPGEIVSIFGENLGPATGSGPVLSGALHLATQVEQIQVLFDGVAGAILYGGTNQINVVVPETVRPSGKVAIQVLYYGLPSAQVRIATGAASPGIFSYPVEDKSYAAALNPEGALQGPAAPLRRGATAVFYATGLGLPVGVTADAVGSRALELPVRPSVLIGGRPAQVSYAGLSPTLTAGLAQLNVVIPADAPTGAAVEVVVSSGGITSGNVWVSIE